MNVWDLASVVAAVRVLIALIVIGVLIEWTRRHHHRAVARRDTGKRHDRG